jgi:hypothetical protein
MIRNEYRVVTAVVACVLAVEASLNWLEPSLSGDVAHIMQIAEVSRGLNASSSPAKVLWLGNSLTGEGIDMSVADSVLEQELGTELAGFTVHPDGSSIAEWHHIANNEFFDRGAVPDLLIVPFAWNLLSDQNPVNVQRIARWYLNRPEQWLDFLRHDTEGLEEKFSAVLASFSAAYGNRDRVRDRVLVGLPGYEYLAFELGNPGAGAGGDNNSAAEVSLTYARLRRLAKSAREHGVRLAVVAMPVVGPYKIDSKLLETADLYDIIVIDARDTDGINEGWFRDDMHLLPDGARQVTRRIAIEVGRAWSEPRHVEAQNDSSDFAVAR